MRLEVFRVSTARQLPEDLFWALDGVDTRYIAAFDNYPDTLQYVVGAWGTTGDEEVNGQPIAALVATFGHIITGYIDLLAGIEGPIDPNDWPENEELPPPLEHKEPDVKRRLRIMLARLRKVSRATWLIVHDADFVEGWIEQGFRVVEPPADIAPRDAVHVLVWGTLPEDIYSLLRARGLSWRLTTHRYHRDA